MNRAQTGAPRASVSSRSSCTLGRSMSPFSQEDECPVQPEQFPLAPNDELERMVRLTLQTHWRTDRNRGSRLRKGPQARKRETGNWWNRAQVGAHGRGQTSDIRPLCR